MPRIAVIADSHFSEDSRFEETIRLHEWIAEHAATQKVDLVVHTGDVFDKKSTPRERIVVAEWLQAMAEIAPVLIVRGNHDVIGDLAIFRELRAKNPIRVAEAAGVYVLGGVAVAAVAWPRKAHLLAQLKAGHEESEQAAGDALRDVLRGLGAELAKHDGPRLLAMHAMVRGSVTSVGQPLVGCDLELGLEDLALAGADFAALGHIHKGQDWEIGDMPVVYPGSPRRTAFGETEPKGYLLVDLDEGVALWNRVIVPATPMELLTGTWWPEAKPEPTFGFPAEEEDGYEPPPLHFRITGGELAGAEVRFRYRVAVDHREAARAAAIELRERILMVGRAATVKLEEEVVATVRARAPEVAAAKTLPEKLVALWKARAIDIDDARRVRVLAKLHELETEAA